MPYDLAIRLQDMSLKKTAILIGKDIYIYTPVLIGALFTVAKRRKQPKCLLIGE